MVEIKLIEALHTAILAEESEKPLRSYLGASLLGKECDRDLWYSFKTPKRPEDARIHLIFETGHRFEEMITDKIKKAGFEIYTKDEEGNQFGFKDGFIKGHIDGVLILNGEPHIFEFKTANNSRFEEMKKHGIKESDPIYYTQVMVYAYKMELKKILFLAINKNTCELYTEILGLDTMHAVNAINRGKSICGSNELPERKYGHKSHFKCKMCQFRKECWEE